MYLNASPQLIYPTSFIDEAYNSIDYTGGYFIVGNQSDEMANFNEPINAFGRTYKTGHSDCICKLNNNLTFHHITS